MVLFTVISLLGLLIFIFILFCKWRYQYWARKGVPQLEPHLLFGDFKPILTGSVAAQDYLMDIYKRSKTKGWNQVGIYKFVSPEWMPLDLKIIKSILLKDFDHFSAHGLYHHETEPLTEHLFNVDGEEWKKLRTKLSPTFTTGKIKMMFETIIEKANVLNKVLNNSANTIKEIQIKETLARFSTDVIGSVAFGIECNSMEEPDNKFRKIGKKALEPSLLRFFVEEIVPFHIPAKLGYRTIPVEVAAYFTEVVKETIKYRQKTNVQRKDFIQLLLQLNNKSDEGSLLTEQEIVTEAYLFYLAGFETSSSATTFALLELSHNQDVQDILRQEIHCVLQKHSGNLTYDAVMEMEYLDKVMHEALRKYPPLCFLPRECTKRYKVPGTDLVIDKGTRVYIPAWGIQKDPEYYPNPEVFNPENFSQKNKSMRPDFTWLPFGEGPRICIGLRFGMMQSKVALITLLKDFKFSPHGETKWPLEMDKGAVVLTAKGDIWLKINKL